MYAGEKNNTIYRAFLLFLALFFYHDLYSSQEWQVMELEPLRTATAVSENSHTGFILEQKISGLYCAEFMTDKGSFTRIEGTGYSTAGEYGEPMLPVVSRLIEIPRGAMVQFRIISFQEEIIDLVSYGFQNPLFPYQPSLSKSVQERQTELMYLEESYSKDQFVGQEIVDIEELGIMRGRQIGRLRLAPVQYNPVKNKLRVLSEIKVEIIFKDIDIASEMKKGLYDSPHFESFLASRLLNYREDMRKTYFHGGPLKYVILSHPMFEEDLREFVRWKTRKGFDVIELYRGQEDVGDTPSEMRAALAEIYHSATPDNPPPTFLLIVGDHEQIPAFQSSGHVTDLYYAEYDGDGDFFPDLFYGRFSAGNTGELLPQIEKTLTYEQFQFPETGFLNEAVFIAGVDSRHAHIHGNGQINYGTEYYFNGNFGINAHAYLVPHESGVAERIKERMSEGAGFVNYCGHGFPDRWDNPRFSIDDISSLGNYGKYSLMIGNACGTSRFDRDECIAEAFLRAENKGAVGYIGASNDAYWDEDFYWAVGVGPVSANPLYGDTGPGAYDRLFHARGEPASEWYVSQGQIQQAGNLAVTEGATTGRSRYYWEIYHLMGDPSLMIYFSEPDTLSMEYQGILGAGTTELAVSTDPYTYVALSGEGELIDAKYSDKNGIARLVFDLPGEGGEYNLVATRENRQPYTGSITVGPVSEALVTLKSFTIGDSRYNNNGIAEAGEMIDIELVLKNAGGEPAENIGVSLACDNNYISLNDTIYEITLIEPGKKIVVDNVFVFDISREIPDGESLFFTLEFYSEDTVSGKSHFAIDVSAPEIEILRVWVDDSDSDEPDGFLMAGETAGLVVELLNSGSSPISDARFVISDREGALNFHKNLIKQEVIRAGDTIQLPFTATADYNLAYGSRLILDMVTESEGFTSENGFYFMANTVYEDFEDGEFGFRPWETDSEKGWIFSRESLHGRYSLRSGKIGHSGTSELQIKMAVAEEGDISFLRKLSSERGYDFLEFYIDDDLMGKWSGFLSWSVEEFEVKPGNRVFRWVYVKDRSVSKGYDCAWIDDVVFPPGSLVSLFSHEMITDLGVEGLISPESGTWISGLQPVTVSVRNYGDLKVSSFGLAYILNGESPVTETIEDDISPGDSLIFTFSEEADLSKPGNYDLTVYTSHPADTVYQNDTLYSVLEVPEIFDVSLAGVLQPKSGQDLSDQEQLEIKIENRGNMELTGFELSYRLNDQESGPEIFGDVLYPETRTTYVFEQALDLSAQGLYDLGVFLTFYLDKKTVNDSISVEIENLVTAIHTTGKLKSAISVFPNPFETDLYIRLNNDAGGSLSVRLFSSTGRLLYHSPLRYPVRGDLLRIDAGHLPPGIYHLEISAGKYREVHRVVRR